MIRKQARLPLVVRLAEQKADEDPHAFLARLWQRELPGPGVDAAAEFAAALHQGRLCLLCDTLNEARRDRLQERIDNWRDFAAALPAGNRLVFTCRTDDYDGRLKVQQVEIDPLDDGQIQQFAAACLHHTQPDAFWSALTGPHADLLPLARTPYYLALLVDEFDAHEELPTQRAQLLRALRHQAVEPRGGQAPPRLDRRRRPGGCRCRPTAFRTLLNNVEGIIAPLNHIYRLSDEDVDNWRTFATWPQARFAQSYTFPAVERHPQPVWWDNGRFNRPTQPVVGINWYEAMAYAAWLARLTGQSPSSAYGGGMGVGGPPRRAALPLVALATTLCTRPPASWSRARPVGVYPHGATPDGLLDRQPTSTSGSPAATGPIRTILPSTTRYDRAGLLLARRVPGTWTSVSRGVRAGAGAIPGAGHRLLGHRLARTLS